jgi:hypothetical protein
MTNGANHLALRQLMSDAHDAYGKAVVQAFDAYEKAITRLTKSSTTRSSMHSTTP